MGDRYRSQMADHEALEREGRAVIVYGFDVSEGFIPQERALFWTRATRDEAALFRLRQQMEHGDWRDFVEYTATANSVTPEADEWRAWMLDAAVEWLAGFDFVGDGDDFELRKYEAVVR